MNSKEEIKRFANEANRIRQLLQYGRMSNRKILIENKKFHNKYAGKRAFIVGNGPSINKQNLKLLADEYVFTVNMLPQHPVFRELKSNFHFFADPVFYTLDKDIEHDVEWLETIRSIGEQSPSTEVFWPLDAVEFVAKNNLDSLMDNYFYKSCGHLFTGYSHPIDYTGMVPEFSTVVQYCITMAIYMGFAEIYLVGCDCTGIITIINAHLKQNELQYAMNISNNYQMKMQELCQRKDILYDYFFGFSYDFKNYILLRNYCDAHGIRLVNATAGGILDSLPRVKFEELF